jgi:hypothetical protein
MPALVELGYWLSSGLNQKKGVLMYDNVSTSTLIGLNIMFTQEWENNPTEVNFSSVVLTERELDRRG